jgi:predicted permease
MPGTYRASATPVLVPIHIFISGGLRMNSLIEQMLTLYGMAFVGYLIRRKGILNEHANGVLTQLILYVTLPALILYSLDISFSIGLVKEMIWLIGLSAFILALSCLIAFWIGISFVAFSEFNTGGESTFLLHRGYI